MKTDDFNFELPESLIAQYPPAERGKSRLFVLDRASGAHTHSMVADIASFIEPGTLMVFNDSKVRRARIYGIAADTGASVEFLLLAPLRGGGMEESGKPEGKEIFDIGQEPGVRRWRVMCGKMKRQRAGRTYLFPGGVEGAIIGETEDERILEFDTPVDEKYLDAHGHIPLPPYIKREDESQDAERYQTIYARTPGSAACPTAGLHFTPEIMASLAEAGIETRWVTLHVGLGTFLPVRTEKVESHVMHEEWYSVPPETALAVDRAKKEGRKVLAVGTTSLRTLESAWTGDRLAAGISSTRIFIYPGYGFKVVDRLFTNFHTPKSTLLMLVSAFAGREAIMRAYSEAIEKGYRFFSYGDAMLIR